MFVGQAGCGWSLFAPSGSIRFRLDGIWRPAVPSLVNAVHTIPAGNAGGWRGGLIPGAAKLPDIIRSSFAATGRGWAHPTSTCRWPAPGRRAGWPEIQEARCDRFRRGASNGTRAGDRREAHGRRACWCLTLRVHTLRWAAACSGAQNRRRRGCRKATRSGAGNRPPWLRSRHPRTRRTSPAPPSGLVALPEC
jgi:hypothetical protein